MNSTKRILSIVLALVMLFSTNIVAFADDTFSETTIEPATDSTETTETDKEKSSINILLKYDASESVELTISDGDIENKIVSELTDDEISNYVNKNYHLETQYELTEIIGKHKEISYQWIKEEKTNIPSEGEEENIPSEQPIEKTSLDENQAANEAQPEIPSIPENSEQKVYDYIFIVKEVISDTGIDCTFNSEVIVPTCTTQGYTKFTCKFCKDVYWGKFVDKLGHDYVPTVTAPTCTEKGYTTYVCSRCDDTYTGDEVAAAGHKEAAPVEENKVDATCGKDGSYDEVVYCSVCKAEISRVQKTIPATGNHTWDDGVVTTEPTEESEGVKTFTCTVCGATKTEPIAPLAHTHTAGDPVRENEVAATCAKEGSYDEVVYCSKCGEEMSRVTKTIDKVAHTYTTKVENRVEPTVDKEGSYDTVTYCSVCNEEKPKNTTKITLKSIKPVLYKTVYFIGEKWDEKVTVEATYDDNSKKIFTLTIPKPSKFSTGKENGNMSFSVKHNVSGKGMTIILSGIKCFSPQVVLEKTAGNDPYNFFENFSSGMNPTRIIYLRSAVKWNYQILLSNIKIELSPEAAKVCNITKTSKKQNWKGHPAEKIVKNLADVNNKEINAEGILEINQTKFFNASKKANDYYVTISGKANGKSYKFKVYLYGVTSVKPTTKSTILTFGNPSKFSVNFKENYIDGTYVNHLKKITLSANAVGKTYVSTKINNRTVKYYYYVKCQAPTVKASSAKKAVNLSWKAVKGATGYKVYRSTSKNKGYKCVKTIKNGKTIKYKDSKLKSKKTYYYKVVAVYSKESKCNSSYSSVKSCKTK